MPVDAIAVTLGRFFSLAFFYLSLCVGGDVLIALFNGFANVMPQPLRLALILLLQRASSWRGVSCVSRVEDEFLLSSLAVHVSLEIAAARMGLVLTVRSLMYISSFHRPENSYKFLPCASLIKPPIALYVPLK